MSAEHCDSSIPVVDFSSWRLGTDKPSTTETSQLTKSIHQAFCSIGFVYLTNHGISQNEIDQVNQIMNSFFTLPADVKSRFKRRGNENHGYVALEAESLNPDRPGDLKEAFNVTPLTAKIWPDDEISGFQETVMNLHTKCCELSLRVLRLMALGLGLEDEYFFSDRHQYDKENVSTVRCLYYPPLVPGAEIKTGQIRCGEHSDYGSITLLFQDCIGGLELKTRSGEYVPAVPVPGAVLINVGDLMQRWTSDTYVSTKHRVVIPKEEEKQHQTRQSIVFFCHPDNDAMITCIDGSNKYPPVSSLDYLQMRFSVTYFKV